MGAILKYLNNYTLDSLIYATVQIAGYSSKRQGFCAAVRFLGWLDSTPVSVKRAERIPCTLSFLNLLFEARLKLHKKKQLPKCKTSNIDVSLNRTLLLHIE